jgi:hypothetical protein
VRGIALDVLIHAGPILRFVLLLVTGMLQRCASLTEERAPGQEADLRNVYTPTAP